MSTSVDRGAHGVLRLEDQRLLTGHGRFVANLAGSLAPDALHVMFVRSTVAHARIVGIDLSVARSMVGVVAAMSAEDLGLTPVAPEPALLHQAMTRTPLARGVVRFVGEAIVAVVATSLAHAADAVDAVIVDYEPLPVVATIDDALEATTLLHPAAETNVALEFARTAPHDDIADDLVVVSVHARNPRAAIAPIEGRSMLAWWRDDQLTVYTSGQGPHPQRGAYAGALGLDPQAVRVVCPDTGGAFGAKAMPFPEELVVAHLARALGRPMLFVESRSESMASFAHARAQQQHVTLIATRDGDIVESRLHLVQDCGAYPRLGAFMPNMGRLMHTGPYRIARSSFEAQSVVTNTCSTVAYRGAGQPEAAAVVERAVDQLARALHMDPIALRRRNFITDFPHTNPGGLVYDSGSYAATLDAACAMARVDERRVEQQARRDRRDRAQLGIGVACFVESCSTSNQPEHARVRVNADGRVLVQSGTTPSGQGHETTWAVIVSDVLGVPVDHIVCETGDSAWFASGTVTGGSRSVQVGGEAVREASVAVLDAARLVAAELLEAHPDDLRYERARTSFHVVGSPARSVSLAQAAASDEDACLERSTRFDPVSGTVSFGAYVAVVEVDTETGHVRLVDFVAADDAGSVVHPALFAGQVHGGVVQGIAQALFEEVIYDEDANLRTSNFADYAMPAASEVPFIRTVVVETPTPHNALGAKGVGESGPIGATPAVYNAVIDALAPLGVDDIELPLTPERVWTALHSANATTPTA